MVISQSIVLFNVIKEAGAAYLIFIGVKSLRATRPAPESTYETHSAPEPMSAPAAIHSGFLTSLLNPKVTLFFLALFTQVTSPQMPLPVKVLYGLTVVLIELGPCALVVSTAPVKRRFDAVAHWIERVTGAILILLGIRLVLARATP